MKKTMIFSVFPGVGSSYLAKHSSYFKLNILDLDSSSFSWNPPGVRNPDFPNNYIEEIKNKLGNVDVILISSHSVVRNALKDNGMMYHLVYPHIKAKDLYMYRYENRGNDDNFINILWLHWEEWIEEMQKDTYPFHHILPAGDFYLSDLFIKA